MPKDALVDAGAPSAVAPQGSWSRVPGMQSKLHRWAVADPGRRFDDLFNFVCDPATLTVAFERIASVPITRFRYRGGKIPNPWMQPHPA